MNLSSSCPQLQLLNPESSLHSRAATLRWEWETPDPLHGVLHAQNEAQTVVSVLEEPKSVEDNVSGPLDVLEGYYTVPATDPNNDLRSLVNLEGVRRC